MERYKTQQNQIQVISKSRFKQIIDQVEKSSFQYCNTKKRKYKQKHLNSQMLQNNKIIPKQARQSINKFNLHFNSRMSVMIQLNKVKRNQALFIQHKPNEKDLLQLPEILCNKKQSQRGRIDFNKKWIKNKRNEQKIIDKNQNKQNYSTHLSKLKLSLQKISKMKQQSSLQKHLQFVPQRHQQFVVPLKYQQFTPQRHRLSQCPSFYWKSRDSSKNEFSILLNTDQNRNSTSKQKQIPKQKLKKLKYIQTFKNDIISKIKDHILLIH